MYNEDVLIENLAPVQSRLIVEGADTLDAYGKPKSYYLTGTFIQGDIRNHNGRIYPLSEIRRAVNQISERLANGESVLGEMDHPEQLQINLDRVSHMITDMHMEGANGCGKMKIIETVPSGQIIKGLLDAGVQLGVSSRGSGNVGPGGYVSEFEIVTIDIVANPSGPNCLPNAIREARKRKNIDYLSKESVFDDRAKVYLKEELIKLIRSL